MKKLAMAAILMCVLAEVGATGPQGATVLSSAEGLRLAREVMSAEMNPPFRTKFGDLRELIEQRGMAPLQDAKMVDAATATFRGYRLVVTRSADASKFQMMLMPTAGCGPAWFGSETLNIYVGKGLGCD